MSASTNYTAQPKSKVDKDFALMRAEWKSLGFVGVEELAPDDYRMVDPFLKVTNRRRYALADGTFIGSQTPLYIYRPVIKSSKYDCIESALHLDHETGRIYQVDTFSGVVGGFWIGRREGIYRVKDHGLDVDAALASAKADHDQNMKHFFENTSRGGRARVRPSSGENKDQLGNPTHDSEYGYDYIEHSFSDTKVRSMVFNNLEGALMHRQQLLEKWADERRAANPHIIDAKQREDALNLAAMRMAYGNTDTVLAQLEEDPRITLTDEDKDYMNTVSEDYKKDVAKQK